MLHHRLAALLTYVTATLGERVQQLRRNPDRGGHAVEYAIGIGLAAAVIIGLFASYKTTIGNIVKSWVTK